MEDLSGRVAVVTGGASGLGRALGERFAAEGMRVVLADVEQPALEGTVAALRARGLEVMGVVTDVRSHQAVEALRDETLAAYGAVHVVCNNAGVGAGGEGHLWEHERNDWRWALEVNVWGVIHGINAFVPVMIERGEEGHVVNTSSGNGGIAPLSTTPEYAVTKAAVTVLTECLHGQLEAMGARVRASVLFPGPHMLRTGLFESWRNRPPGLAKEKPRRTPYLTLDDYERLMAEAGREVEYTPVEEVAERVVGAIRSGNFWILPPSERTDETIRARAESMLKRENPTYLREVAG
ncbi:MAG TPA: SDR family NAD(P)-dependent oxidoreductase [Acidimicrobiales bacterium]|nr:SDR family NAD(P)-dependent oxidoreductase [Acidimicrobiales bacterium]